MPRTKRTDTPAGAGNTGAEVVNIDRAKTETAMTKTDRAKTAVTSNTEVATVDRAKAVVKRRRNRPDLQNFGAENVEKGDNTRYLRHALAIYNLPPIDISDDKQVAERLQWYFNHCTEDDMKPTVTGMANSLGIDKRTLYSWKAGECRGQTHSPLIKKAYDMLETLWEEYMLNNKVNPASGIFLGRNHWGYQDKVEVVVAPAKQETDYNAEEIAARYMLDSAKDSETVETAFTDDLPKE